MTDRNLGLIEKLNICKIFRRKVGKNRQVNSLKTKVSKERKNPSSTSRNLKV